MFSVLVRGRGESRKGRGIAEAGGGFGEACGSLYAKGAGGDGAAFRQTTGCPEAPVPLGAPNRRDHGRVVVIVCCPYNVDGSVCVPHPVSLNLIIMS